MLTLLCDRSPSMAGRARQNGGGFVPRPGNPSPKGGQGLWFPPSPRGGGRAWGSSAHQPKRPHRRQHGHQHLRVEPRHRADDRRQLRERPQHDRHHRRVRVLVLADVDVRAGEHVVDHRPPAEERRARQMAVRRGLGHLRGVFQARHQNDDREQPEKRGPKQPGGEVGGPKTRASWGNEVRSMADPCAEEGMSSVRQRVRR